MAHEDALSLLEDAGAPADQIVDLAFELALWGLGPAEQQQQRALIADAGPILRVWSSLDDQADKDRIVSYANNVLELRELEDEITVAVANAPIDEHNLPEGVLGVDDLRQRGFSGFIPLRLAREKDSPLSKRPGVYVVLKPSDDPPTFLDRSVGGFYRGDPTVEIHVLEGRWNDDCPLQYVGMTNDALATRVRALARFGIGEKVSHYGGRYLWQLADHADFLRTMSRALLNFAVTIRGSMVRR